MEKVEDKLVHVGMGKGLEVTCNQKLKMTIAQRVQVLCKRMPQAIHSLPNVEEASVRALNTVDEV